MSISSILSNITKNFTIEERDYIAGFSKNNNTYVFIYSLNRYIVHELTKGIERIEADNIAGQIEFLKKSLADCFIVHIKQSLLPVITHEYNLLKENDYLNQEQDFDYYTQEISNSSEWIAYFFDKYSGLDFLLLQSVGLFCTSTVELLERLNENIYYLKERFKLSSSKIIGINSFAGDLHNNWKSTASIKFENQVIYYKPRSLQNELAVQEFFQKLNELGLQATIHQIDIAYTKGQDYGWMAGVNYEPVRDGEELKAFYINQGINLAAAYFLGISDLIGDNIIAVGQTPAFYDLECILQPTLINRMNALYDNSSGAAKLITTSVLRTGLLPQFGFQTETHPGISNAGLSLVSDENILPQMIIEYENGQFKRHFKKLPFDSDNSSIPSLLSGERFQTSEFIVQLVDGFKIGYDFFAKHRNKLNSCLITYFNDIKIRILYRSTFVYSRLLNEVYHPKYLVSQDAIDSLFKSLENASDILNQSKMIIESEIKQIKKLDIPIFYTYTNSRHLYNANEEVLSTDFFKESGISEASQRLMNASEHDKQIQLELILTSFIIHESLPSDEISVNTGSLSSFSETHNSISVGKEDFTVFTKEAKQIGNDILKSAIYKDDLPSFWGITQSPNYTWILTNKGFGLFDGTDGLAFFYLNLYKTTQNKNYLKAGLSLVEVAIKQFGLYSTYYEQPSGFNKNSLFNYPLSSFYVAEFFLKEGISISSLTDDALGKLKQWIDNAIAKDVDYDLLSGNAGCIIYLCTVYERTQDESYLILAEKAAEHIVAHKTAYKNTYCWSNIHKKGFVGFSHGSSGIAYALFRLNSFLKRDDLKEVAIKAIEYERLLFDSESKTWPFFMFTDSLTIDYYPNHFWAYGSGSIALSRILISPYYTDELFLDEITIAKDNIISKGPVVNHNISSGLFGNLYILQELACYLQDQALTDLIISYTKAALLQKDDEQLWRGAPVGKRNAIVRMDGLLTGSAGVGYMLLKLADWPNIPRIL